MNHDSIIDEVSDELRPELGKVHARCVGQTVAGMIASSSVRLTEIGRALGEDVPLHATRKRLSRNLSHPGIEPALARAILRRSAFKIDPDALLVVAPSRIIKKYAKDMEFIHNFSSGDQSGESRGYAVEEVISWDLARGDFLPLGAVLWSQNAPGSVTECDVFASMLQRARQATSNRGIVVCNHRSLCGELAGSLAQDESSRFALNLDPAETLLYKGREISSAELAQDCPLQFSDVIYKVHPSGYECKAFVQFGFAPVRLPAQPDRPLWLAILQHEGRLRQLILTSEALRKNRRVVQWALEVSNEAWRAEAHSRKLKELYGFDDIRLLKYQSLKNLTALFHYSMFFGGLPRLGEAVCQRVRFATGRVVQPSHRANSPQGKSRDAMVGV